MYPWHFVPRRVHGNIIYILLHSWPPESPLAFVEDTLVNIALYFPLGFAGYLALRKRPWLPVVIGFLLSCAIEMGQLYTVTRVTSMMDVLNNAAGAALGVVAALTFEEIIQTPRVHSLRLLRNRGAVALLSCWIVSGMVPFFPVLRYYQPHRKLLIFLHSPAFDAVTFISAAASWVAAGILAEAMGIRVPRWLALTATLAVPAQVFILTRQPLLSGFTGAIAGVVIFLALIQAKRVNLPEAGVFLAVIAFRGLAPFEFVAQSSPFSWIPFAGFLGADWLSALMTMSEKIFFYGTAVWLFHAAGLRLWRSVAVVAVGLFAIEIAQIHLPGRTPEITDPLLAVLIGFVLAILNRAADLRDLPLDFQTSSSNE